MEAVEFDDQVDGALSGNRSKKDDIHAIVHIIEGWDDKDLKVAPSSLKARKVYAIPVGQGKQSFKWLSAAVQGRILDEGGLRQGTQRTAPQCLITGIYAKDGTPRQPSQKLDQFVEEDFNFEDNGKVVKVYAQISTEYISDEWGHPVMTEWRAKCDVYDKYHEALMREMQIRKDSDNVDKMDLAFSSTDDKSKTGGGASASFVQIGDFNSSSQVDATFELDWNVFSWSCIPVPVSEMQQTSIKLALREGYNLVCNIFAHFSGTGKIGERYGMTKHEVRNLFHNCGISETGEKDKSGNVIEKAMPLVPQFADLSMTPSDFKAGAKGGDEAPISIADTPLVTRVQLAQLMVSVAFFMSNTRVGLAETLQDSLLLPLGLYFSRVNSSYLYYSNADPMVRSCISSNFYDVRRIFYQHSGGDVFGPTMNFDSFFRVVTSSGILGYKQREEARLAFLHSQLDSARPLSHIVYIEFIEAFSYLIIATQLESTKGFNFSDGKKLKIALSVLSDTFMTPAKK